MRAFAELHRELLGSDPESPQVTCEMETRGQPRSPHGPAEVWVDLGPHPLALVDAVAPGGGVDWTTLRGGGMELQARVGFDWVSGDRRIPVDLDLRRSPGGQGRPARRVSNGRIDVEYEGRTVDGEFVSVLRAQGCEKVTPDFMHTSVERFIDAAVHGD